MPTMPKTNSKSKIQTLLGDETSAALSTHGWRKNTENPSVYGIEKPFNEATVLFYFNLYNKTNYSVFPFQKIIFNDLTSTLTNALPTLAAETDLTVCISDTFYTFENLPVLNASSDLPAITNLFSGQILACEDSLHATLANQEYVFQQNTHRFHWKWLSPPYWDYALFMISYALVRKNRQIFNDAALKLNELKNKDLSISSDEMAITDKLLRLADGLFGCNR